MRLPTIRSAEDIIKITEEIGFLPFFKTRIDGFSVKDAVAPELWFSDSVDGPWEWKGPIARSKKCVYGKFFGGKAGWISPEVFADFANYRRDGYDFDARFDDGLTPHKDKAVFDAIAAVPTILSKELKARCGYGKDGNKGFETVITRLQMQTYVVAADFPYMTDRDGKPYGWGVAQYATPENLYGYDAVTAAYHRDPAESLERLLVRLCGRFPEIPAAEWKRFLK